LDLDKSDPDLPKIDLDLPKYDSDLYKSDLDLGKFDPDLPKYDLDLYKSDQNLDKFGGKGYNRDIKMDKNILIVSFTPFYGGGESFVKHILEQTFDNAVYAVMNEHLYNELNAEHKYLLKPQGIIGRIRRIQKIIREEKIDVVILNGGSALFVAPFIGGVKKAAIRHTLHPSIHPSRRFYYIPLLQAAYFFSDLVIHVSRASLSEQYVCKKKGVGYL